MIALQSPSATMNRRYNFSQNPMEIVNSATSVVDRARGPSRAPAMRWR